MCDKAVMVEQSTSDGTSYSVTACGKVIRTKGNIKTTLGEYSGSFDVYSAQGIQLDYSGDHDDKCLGELLPATIHLIYMQVQLMVN